MNVFVHVDPTGQDSPWVGCESCAQQINMPTTAMPIEQVIKDYYVEDVGAVSCDGCNKVLWEKVPAVPADTSLMDNMNSLISAVKQLRQLANSAAEEVHGDEARIFEAVTLARQVEYLDRAEALLVLVAKGFASLM